MKENQTHMGLRVVLFVVLGLFLLPSATAQGPPVEQETNCLFYSYTQSGEFFFLIQNNSKVFGNDLFIIHNCENIDLEVDGQFYASSENNLQVKLEDGIHNLTITSSNLTKTYQVEIYPDRLEWEQQYLQLNFRDPNSEMISIDLSNNRENFATLFGILVVWVLSTMVYWKLIQSYVDRNFIEEVVN